MWGLILVGVAAFLATGSVEAAQSFVERPKSMTVMVHTTITLKCIIKNRRGDVQWTKGGHSLGFNRSIPGLPRYSITGSDSGDEVEYSLQIEDVRLDDDDKYTCQVTPVLNNGPLFAEARLTVMAPSEEPFIENFNNNSKVEARYTDTNIVLVCVARAGKPAADIHWYRNGQRVTRNIEYTTLDIPDSKKVTARSQLTISLTDYQEENGKEYKCEAKKEGLWIQPLKPAVVKLDILYPPGPPQISGYNGQPLLIGDTVPLRCVSRGGNPVGSVEWFRFDAPVQRRHTSAGNEATNLYNYRARAADNNAVYSCSVDSSRLQMEPLRANYTMKVYFPPERVTMEESDFVMQNDDAVFTCKTAVSNPKATISWFIEDEQMTSVTETYQLQPSGGWRTISRCTFKATSIRHSKVITCRAVNENYTMNQVSATRSLNIYYPPTSLKISIRNYTETTMTDVQNSVLKVRAGENKKFECSAVGGNPMATLKWYKGSTELTNAFSPTGGPIATSQLSFLVKPQDNNATFKCEARNAATSVPLVARVRLSVIFPPENVRITVSKNPSRVGDQITLDCECSSSNPTAAITWTKNRRYLHGTDLGPEPAEYGGRKSTNRLSITVGPRDHNSVFRCSANNEELQLRVTNSVTLNVKFKPQFDTATLPATIQMRKGQRSSIDLSAAANPPHVSYQLFKDGAVLSPLPSHFNMSSGILTISKVEKADKGNYVMKATNSEGSTEFSFAVVVKYPATISRISPVQSVDEGNEVAFVCEADAYPVVPNMFTWFREGFDLSRFRAKQEGKYSTLKIRHLKREDAGKFKCTVDNQIGSPSYRSAELIVRFSPVIDKSPEMSRSAGRPGTDVIIWCNTAGAPHVEITWTRNNTQVRPNGKFEVNTTQVGAQYKSKLKIKSVTSDDYGAYVCTATNSKGSDSHSITLAGTTKPYPPYNINVVNKTARSITIAWKAGFNGGLSQSFRIRYKPVEASGYVFRDVQPYGALSYKLKSLQLDVEYEITVLAFNDKGESAYPIPGITVRTLGRNRGLQTRTSTKNKEMPADVMTSDLQGSDETPVIIILVVCIVGVFILTLNVGLILFFIRKRKKRLEGSSDTTSHTNTFELYGSSNKADHNLYPPPSDDTRSYGTCDKSMDDFSDDYIKDYDRECETHVFLPPLQSDYPGCRPYSPSQKLGPGDSPRLLGGGHKMTTYIADDKPGRISPWSEDPYKRSQPTYRKGSYENGIPNGDVYEFKSARGKGMNELSDRPSHRPPSRSGSTSVLSPNIVANPNYSGPVSSFGSSNGGINHQAGRTTASINHHHHPSSSRASPSPYKSNNYSSSSSNIHRPPPSPHNTVPAGSEFRGHLV